MKTSALTITAICGVFISLTTLAQRNHNETNTQIAQKNQTQENKNDRHYLNSNQHHQGGNWGGGITVQFGNYPNYNGNYYGNNYGNGYNYSVKNAARNSIRQSAQVIKQALQFSEWNDSYSPWLAKAIRHQQYAKQLYFWGDYNGALNHAERSGFLAWNTLSYFNNSYGYDDGYAGNNYPNPYSDPNNPYYRKGNTIDKSGNTTNDNGDFDYRKRNDDKPADVKEVNQTTENNINKTEIDGTLPQSKINDKELLKINVKDLDIE